MRDLKWKLLKSEYLFKDLWFTVRKDTCERPDGKLVTPYYVYEFPTWVNAVAITEDGKIILERQYRHGLGETHLEIPGGCVDDTDKNYEEAIARELLEETGYSFTHYEYLGKTSSNPSTNNNWMHMYLATGGKKVNEQELDDNEDIEIHLVTMDELKQLLRDNQIVQSMHVTTIMYALAKLGELKF
ncbi:DNA mismatch repair protein MutT [Niastella koreensis]|uniref:GDP-mannose pyrophosphatase n=2 Tax=Niastella koreensis TaxID=354356 RepID=G8TFL2_NIAKG|nr:NUDIX hydrolase [Niastella koreensis]AEV98443.1 NUDIX hydrolase [Niastella koreensis GR20-10]OQP53110.1 DNA mismatch repair protein MutT [Niastella koreensis]